MKKTIKPLAGGLLAGVLALQAGMIPAAVKAAAAPVPVGSNPVLSYTAPQDLPAAPIRKVTVGKARYAPGEIASFTVSFDQSKDWSGTLQVEFYQLNRLIAKKSQPVKVSRVGSSDFTVNWQPPSADFRGYLVKAYISGKPDAFQTAALDVSSDWTHFPRYGYVTEFPQESAAQSDAKLKQMSQDYYLNGYQFYDWMWRHDVSVYSRTDENGKPILDANGNFINAPFDQNTSYLDLLGRHLYPLSVKQQVEAAQKYGSAAMAYEMNYAARERYEDFGVKREWGLYNKNAVFPNPDPVKYQNGFFFDSVNPPTALYLQDPGNPEWQAYVGNQFNRAVNVFGFDGIHLDQWGAWDGDFLYDYYGNPRYYSKDYDSLINSVKDQLTSNNSVKNHVTFNMVGGNSGYADVPNPGTKTDFDYSEIWQDKDRYRDVKQVVDDTREKDGGKAMVIAGYMNYKQATGDQYPASDVQGVPRTVLFQSTINKIPGWVGDFGKKDEDKIIWTVRADAAGTYDLKLKYGHGNDGGSPEGRLTVNGTVVAPAIPLTQKTGWGNPIGEAVVSTELQAGDNTVTLQLNTSDLWLNVDSLVVSGNGTSREYEAENAELVSCKVDKYGHVFHFETDGDFITFDVNVPAEGNYPIAVSYGIESEPAVRDLWVNDAPAVQGLSFGSTGGWETFKEKAVTVPLHAGANTVTLKVAGVNDNGMKVDYLRIGDIRYEAEKARIGWHPTQNAQIQIQPGVIAKAYVTNMRNAPDSVEFDVAAAQAGTYKLAFQYATANTPVGVVTVNGTVYGDPVALASSGGWGSEGKWSWQTVSVPLQAGNNAVRLALTTSGQYLNLDGLLTEPELILVNDARVTAQGGVAVNPSSDTDAKTDNFNGDPAKSVTFTFNSATGGDYTLGFRYRSGNHVTGQATVNGAVYAVDMPSNDWYSPGSGWGSSEIKAGLQQGTNTVTLKLDSTETWLNLHGLSYGRKLEAEAPETRVNGVVKGALWTDDFGSAGDSVTFTQVQADAGVAPVTFTYKSSGEAAYLLQTGGTALPVAFQGTNGDWAELTVNVPLQQGTNSIKLVPAANLNESVQLDQVKIGETVVEAESDSVVKAGITAVEAQASVVGYVYDFKQQGDFLSLTFGPAGSSGTYDLNVYYRNNGAETKRSVYVNGKKAGVLTLAGGTADWTVASLPVFLSSMQPENKITVKMENASEPSGIDIDRLEVNGSTLEAENAETGWEPVVPKTGSIAVVAGKTDNHGLAGQTVIFNVDLKEDVTGLVFNYRSGNNPIFDILADDQLVAHDVTFGSTPGGWGGGMAEKWVRAAIPAGAHTIKLVMVSDGQYINLDSLIAGDREYEVEDATFAPDGNGITTTAGYVDDFKDEGDFVTFEVNAPAAGAKDLTFRFKNDAVSTRDAVRALYLDQTKIGDVTFPYTGDTWSTITVANAPLLAGANPVTLKVVDRDDDGVKIDYLDAGTDRYHAEKANFIPPMTLYKNLLLNFGHVGDEVSFNVNLEQAGETSLIFVNANSGSVATKTLYVDGQPVLGGDGKPVRIWFSGTGGKDSFNEDAYFVVPYLGAGPHTVTLKHEETDKGSIDLSRLTVGFFSEPSIRLMDAALAAMGATHIELGTAEKIEEGPNMLAHEYYPNRSKKMKPTLKESMKEYYKFFAAYENVLFDSREDQSVGITVEKGDGTSVAVSKDGTSDTLWAIARKNGTNPGFERYDILHLVNLLQNDDNWRNAAAEPEKLAGIKVSYPVGITAQDAPGLKVYAASPDHNGGALKELKFTWNGTNLVITLPELKYWEMIVIDRDGSGLIVIKTPVWSGDKQLIAKNIARTSLELNWTAASSVDGTEVAYRIYKGSQLLDTTKELSYNVTGLEAGKSYTFTVQAVDPDGNATENGPSASFKTQSAASPDTTTVSLAPVKQVPDDTVSVNENDLKNALDGKIIVEIADGKNKVVLSGQAVGKIGTNKLELKKGKISLIVPNNVLKQALALSKGSADLQIVFEINELSAEQSGLLVQKAVEEGTKVKLAGRVLELGISVWNGQTAAGRVESFDSPVEIVVAYEDAGVNEELLGLYYWNEQQNAWDYVGGEIDRAANKAAADLTHFSKYALMEYAKSFDDVPSGHWAFEAVRALAAKHIVKGSTALAFQPEEQTTRAEFSALLVRALGLKAQSGSPFQDVDASKWYAGEIAAAYNAKLVTGKSETLFAPDDLITREEMAAIMVRALEYKKGVTASGLTGPVASFEDDEQISEWAKPYVNQAVALGVMEGPDGVNFAPAVSAKRAETAQVIYRLLKR